MSKLHAVLGCAVVLGAVAAVLGIGPTPAPAEPRPAQFNRRVVPMPKPSHAGSHVVAPARPRPPAVPVRLPRQGADWPPDLLRADDGTLEAVVFPPKDVDVPHPVTVMLHGMCDEPTNECPHFAPAVTTDSWLVCPRGRVRCQGGGAAWDWHTDETVEAALDRAAHRYGSAIDTKAGRTLIGFSLGGIFGMNLAHRAKGRYPRVILIGAKIFPQAALLRSQGVERLVLAAGDNDMMRWHMAEQARRTDRRGLPTRFISFGPVGHWFPSNLTDYLRDALDWTAAPEQPVSLAQPATAQEPVS